MGIYGSDLRHGAAPGAAPGRSAGREHAEAGVVLVPELLGVATDEQTAAEGVEHLDAVAPGTGRVPRQRLARGRVDRADAGPGDRAGPGRVVAERVVQPALVAAD